MAILAVLLVLALVLGGIGLLIEGLFWLAVIALLLLVAAGVVGFASRGRAVR